MSKRISRNHLRIVLLLNTFLVVTFSANASAQSYSLDGNRWYEVEISVFTNRASLLPGSEQTDPTKTRLNYPSEITKLRSRADLLAIEFSPAPLTAFPLGNIDSISFPADLARDDITNPDIDHELLPAPVNLGPEYSPGSSDFHLANTQLDPYIQLGSQFHTFQTINARISNSFEHRLLMHQVWRQPVTSKSKSEAVFIIGGEQYGEHHELEGSVTLSYNVNRIDVDANIWRAVYSTGNKQFSPSPWTVPTAAYNEDELSSTVNNSINRRAPRAMSFNFDTATGVPQFNIEDIALLKETRSMVSNTIHYLDHPELGILIEVRPYQLPNPNDSE